MLLEGTIHVVQACLAYARLDGLPSAGPGFLRMQKYDPDEVADAEYAVTFDIHGKAFARVLTLPRFVVPDFADLYGHPWENYRVCGYSRFWISRVDGGDITPKQRVRLERVATSDLRFDYDEGELDISFDHCFPEGTLLVNVQDGDDLCLETHVWRAFKALDLLARDRDGPRAATKH
jgi:hypothetical protein